MQRSGRLDIKTHFGFATTPKPPRASGGYEAMAQSMFEIALRQPGQRAGNRTTKQVAGSSRRA